MSTKKSIAKKEANAVAVSDDRPAWAGSGRGNENTTTDDLIIPRIGLIQDISPQLKASQPEYVEGAKAGDMFNTVSGELYGNEITFIPCYFRKEYVVWKNREAGGGFCGAFPTEAEALEVAEQLGTEPFGKKKEPMHEVLDTAQHFGFIVHDDGSTEDVVLSLSKSGMKLSRQMLTMAKMAGGDYFASAYKLTSYETENSTGDMFWATKAQRLGWVNEEMYQHGEKIYDAVNDGTMDVAREVEIAE